LIIEFEKTLPRIADDVFIAPTSAVIGDVEIGKSSSVWFSAVVRGDFGPVRIGKGCTIQDCAVVHVHHDAEGNVFQTTIEDDCIIGHGAVLEGCYIGRGCLIGMNAVVLPHTVLGEGCIVAAGAVVKEGENIPAYTLLAGTPATIKCSFDGPSPELAWGANEYRKLAARY